MATLPDRARGLIDDVNFGVVATVNADGSPQTSVLWIKRDGDDLLFCTVRGRRKERNMTRDPRVSVTVLNARDGYEYVEIRGTVSITEEGGRELIDDLSRKYVGSDFRAEPPEIVRVAVRVTPTRVVVR